MSILEQIQIVTIDSPIDIWNHEEVRVLFNDLIQLKIDGYNHGFQGASHRVLPLDDSDFYGIHEIVCVREKERLVPLLSYKSIPLEYGAIYNRKLPIHKIAMGIKDEKYLFAVTEYVDKVVASQKRISYDSSLTILPTLTNVELRYNIFRIFVALTMHHMYTLGIDNNIITATAKFNTTRTFRRMGCKRLEYAGEPLPAVNISTLANEEVVFFICDREFSPWARQIMEEYRHLWERRLILSCDTLGGFQQAA